MDKARKKQIKKYISWILMAALVAALAAMPMLAQEEAEADGPKASILKATVNTGSIEAALHGGGTISAGDAMDVTIPTGVKITDFLVKNGDVVTEGTPVATVDKVSLMNAIVQVQDTLDYLQEQIVSADGDTVSSQISATAGGLVKAVYAQAGDKVQDVMLEHGALAVLSLDGRMAVELERNMRLSAGDTVWVTFADGTEVAGRVESSLDGIVIVSLEDEDYEIGAKVTVTTDDGDRIGTGALYVHNAWKAAAFSGVVSSVYAKENTDVYAGSTLFTLTETDFTGTRDSMASLHREYEELLQEMFQMYETGTITAPCDGMVSGVDEDSAFLLSALDGEQGWFVDLLGNTTTDSQEKGWTVMLLSNVTTECTGTDTDGTFCTAEEHIEGCYFYCTGRTNCTAKKHSYTCLSQCISSQVAGQCTNGAHKTDCIDGCLSCDEGVDCPSEIHKSNCIESCVSSNGTTDCPATKHHLDCIESCTKAADCPASTHYDSCLTHCDESENCTAECHKETCYMADLTYTAYAALVEQVGAAELIVRMDTATEYQIKTGSSGWVLVEPTSLNTSTLITPGTVPVSNPSAYSAGDVILVWTGYKDGNPVKSGAAVYTSGGSSNPGGNGGSGNSGGMGGGISGMGSMSGLSGMMSGFGSLSGITGSGSASTFQLFDLNGQVLMTVTDQSAMTLTINLDEHDIAKVSEGQTAAIDVTALKGQSFEAVVTEIGASGTNSGGSSKFTVELSLPLAENMLSGMNATATIPLYTKMDVLTIPVAALAETKTGTVVYTALDPETGEPASPVEVTTGISDGETVEILSGLNSGDTIYYSYYDTLELDHTAKAEASFSFG